MTKFTEDRLLEALKLIRLSLNEEIMQSLKDREKAKALAAKLYISHSNRLISLNEESFNMIVKLLELSSFDR